MHIHTRPSVHGAVSVNCECNQCFGLQHISVWSPVTWIHVVIQHTNFYHCTHSSHSLLSVHDTDVHTWLYTLIEFGLIRMWSFMIFSASLCRIMCIHERPHTHPYDCLTTVDNCSIFCLWSVDTCVHVRFAVLLLIDVCATTQQ